MGFPTLASEFPNDNAEISGGAIWIGAQLTGPATLERAPFRPVPAEAFVLFFDDESYLDGPVELELAGGGPSVTVHATDPAEVLAATKVETTAEIQTTSEVETTAEIQTTSEVETTAEIQTTTGIEVTAKVETVTDVEATAPIEAPSEVGATAPIEATIDLEAETSAFAHFESALAAALMAQGASRSAALLPRLLRLEPLPADGLGKDVLLTLQSRGYLDGHARYSQKFRDLCGAWSAVLRGSSQDFGACGTTTLDRFGADLLAALLAVPATRADELRRELRRAGIAAFGVLEAA